MLAREADWHFEPNYHSEWQGLVLYSVTEPSLSGQKAVQKRTSWTNLICCRNTTSRGQRTNCRQHNQTLWSYFSPVAGEAQVTGYSGVQWPVATGRLEALGWTPGWRIASWSRWHYLWRRRSTLLDNWRCDLGGGCCSAVVGLSVDQYLRFDCRVVPQLLCVWALPAGGQLLQVCLDCCEGCTGGWMLCGWAIKSRGSTATTEVGCPEDAAVWRSGEGWTYSEGGFGVTDVPWLGAIGRGPQLAPAGHVLPVGWRLTGSLQGEAWEYGSWGWARLAMEGCWPKAWRPPRQQWRLNTGLQRYWWKTWLRLIAQFLRW